MTWPEIPKINGPKRPEASIEGTLLRHINFYEYICIQAEKIAQLELRKEMIRRELACRAEAAKPSFERLLRIAYGWLQSWHLNWPAGSGAVWAVGFQLFRLAMMGRAGGGAHDLGCDLPQRWADVASGQRSCLC